MSPKVLVMSYESSAGRTSLVNGLFSAGLAMNSGSFQIMGYDIEKPDLMNGFNALKFEAKEVYAGFPKIDKQHCRFCGACIGYCESGAIKLDRYTPAISIDPERCWACGQCVDGCNIHGIALKERLTGYILFSHLNGHQLVIGQGEENHDFLVPLICAMNRMVNNDSVTLCDAGPGISGFVQAAMTDVTLAVIVVKPSRGWTRNIQFLLELLQGKRIKPGIVINKYRNETGFLHEVNDFCKKQSIPLLGLIPFIPALENNALNCFFVNNSEIDSIFAPVLNEIILRS